MQASSPSHVAVPQRAPLDNAADVKRALIWAHELGEPYQAHSKKTSDILGSRAAYFQVAAALTADGFPLD